MGSKRRAMNYAQARLMIKTGDLLAFTHTARGSLKDLQLHLVRMFTKSEFCHVGIAYVVHDRVFVLEAVSTGVRMFPLSMALPFYLVSNPIPLKDSAIEWAFAQIGNAYESKWQMVLAYIFKTNLKNNKRFQCAEYVNGILNANDQHQATSDIPAIVVEMAMRQWGALTYVN